MNEAHRILIVDDHPALRGALAFVLNRQPGFTVVGEAGSLKEARGMLEDIDLAVLDLQLPDGDGVELIEYLHRANPRARTLVLTESLDRAQHGRAVAAGAAGVLHKGASLADIIDALKRLASGEALLSTGEMMDLLKLAASYAERQQLGKLLESRLTPREREVLQALADGLDSGQIAGRLGIRRETSHAHMVRLFAKLGVHSRTEALIVALRHNLVEASRPGSSS